MRNGRGRRSRWLAFGVGAVAVLALVLLGWRARHDGGDGSRAPASAPAADHLDAAGLARFLACSDSRRLSRSLAPIRGGAATSGLTCRMERGRLDVFQRAPVGDCTACDVVRSGGTDANLDRLLGAGRSSVECPDTTLIVGRRWFVVAHGAALGREVVARLGAAQTRPTVPMAPPASYLPTACAPPGYDPDGS